MCKVLIGLSFLFIEMKELCEAIAKLETSSNFQIYRQGVNLTPPIWNSQRTEWTYHFSMWWMTAHSKQSTTSTSDPPYETARGQSGHITFQCDEWQPIQNSQLKGKCQEISVNIYTFRYQRERLIQNLRCSNQIGSYCHLVVKNGNFTFLLTSSHLEWQCHISTDI